MILYATLSGSPPPPHRWWDSGGDLLRAPNNLCSYDGIPPEVLERLAGSGSGKTHGGSLENKSRGEVTECIETEATQCHVIFRRHLESLEWSGTSACVLTLDNVVVNFYYLGRPRPAQRSL
jgi:hypothetical protein